MKKKFTKEELSKLAQGVFKDDKTSPSIYANEEGTFLNAEQYEQRKKAGTHKAFVFEFKNPRMKRVMVVDDQSTVIAELKAELAGKDTRIAELTDEISKYEHKTTILEADLGKAHVIISERDAELADLKAKLNGPSVVAPEPAKKKSTKPSKA